MRTATTAMPPTCAPSRPRWPRPTWCCRARLASLDTLEPLFFHPWDDYDESQRLKPGVVARSAVQWNPARPEDGDG